MLVADVTLIKGEMITAQVRLSGGATRTLTLNRPLPIAQIRKFKPELVAEVDRLLDKHCDREIAELLNHLGRKTWEGKPFNLKKIACIRSAYKLPSRHERLHLIVRMRLFWGAGKSWGSSCGIDRAGFQPTIDHGRSRLKQALRAMWRPAHLPQLVHARIDQEVDHGFCSRTRNWLAFPVTPTIIDHRTLVQFEIGRQFVDEVQKPLHFCTDRRRMFGNDALDCYSACNFGSDSLLMKLRRRMAMVSQENQCHVICSSHNSDPTRVSGR